MKSSVACDETPSTPPSSATTLRDAATFRDDPAPPLDAPSTFDTSDDLRGVLAFVAAFFVGVIDCSASSAAAAAAAALDLGVPVVATTFLPPPPAPLPPTRIVCECVKIAPVGVL